MNNPPYLSNRRAQGGLTLLEVLVAILVLSIGLLGLAGLQATSLQTNQGAQIRSQAVNIAYDMADRVRANREQARNGDYDNISLEPTDCDEGLTREAGPHSVEVDIAGWQNLAACLLPGGRGGVTRDGNDLDVTVQWVDRTTGAVTDDTEVMVRVRLW